MLPSRCNLPFVLVVLLLGGSLLQPLPCGAEAEKQSFNWNEISPVELDLQSRPVSLRYPYSVTQLKALDALPSQFYVYATSEVSDRLETNPYQAPHRFRNPFVENTQVFRVQNNVTLGYALTPKDRVSVSFFHLVNKYDNFTRYRLDGSSYSISPSYQHTWLQKDGWQLSSNLQARQTLTSSGGAYGGLLPSTTVVKSLGTAGYTYLNGALDLGRSNFAIGDVDTLTPSFTLGYGWQMPYDAKRQLLRPLGGLGVSLSGTYSFNTTFNSDFPAPSNYQNYILTAEVYKPLYRHSPVSAFVRSENVFNTGHHRDAFGVSGINYRLFGGLRATMSKPAVFVRKLPYAADSRQEPARKGKD